MQKLSQAWQNFIFILISIDQTLGMILGFIMHPASKELWPDETLSARCGRLGHRYPYKFWRVVIDALFWWQGPGHCVNAHKKELTRYHFPPSMRSDEVGVNYSDGNLIASRCSCSREQKVLYGQTMP